MPHGHRARRRLTRHAHPCLTPHARACTCRFLPAPHARLAQLGASHTACARPPTLLLLGSGPHLQRSTSVHRDMPLVGTEAEQEAERASLQAYFHVDDSKDGHICVHASALPTILYHYEDTLAEESENSTKGRHAPTRQAGLSELLCVVGRLLLRKVLTSYQSSLEEEQNQQLLVRLVLSYFQAQALERQAAANMESLLEEDSTPSKSGASKRKLKKDRRLKRQEQEIEDAAQIGGEVTWDEDQVRQSRHY